LTVLILSHFEIKLLFWGRMKEMGEHLVTLVTQTDI